jgi:hypothetical protein
VSDLIETIENGIATLTFNRPERSLTAERIGCDAIGSVTSLRFFADRAAKKWPLRGSLKLG